MDLPNDVNAWKYETVLEIVRTSTLEPYEYDFKEAVHPTGPTADDVRSRIRKCACSMANSDDGGFIIFGVLDKGDVSHPEKRIVGIKAGEDWSSRFDEHAKMIRPQIPFVFTKNPILLPSDPSKCIFVVRIPSSPRRPHEFDGRFYRRNHGGSAEHMSALEVRDLMHLTEGRLSKLTLLRIELEQFVNIASKIRVETSSVCAYRFETAAIQPLLADTCALFPPGNELVREVINVVSLARLCNELLSKLNWPLTIPSGALVNASQWETQLKPAILAVERSCAKIEGELFKLHGAVRP